MAEHELTKLQRNAVLQAIQGAGLQLGEFDWMETHTAVNRIGPGNPPYRVQALVHSPTEAAFAFDLDLSRGHHYAIFHPGREGPTERINAGDWATQLSYVRTWLDLVKAEHEAPDLWAELAYQRELMIGEEFENTAFTPEEQEKIAEQLSEAKEYVRATYQLEPEQLERLEAQLDYLVDAARRSRRVEWRNMLIGALLSQVMQAVLPAQPVLQLLFVVLRGLAGMFGGGEPTLPGGPPELT